jgi:TonB family protein
VTIADELLTNFSIWKAMNYPCHMKRKICFLFVLGALSSSYGQIAPVVFLDQDFFATDSCNAHFIRYFSVMNDTLYKIHDYYISGELFQEGIVKVFEDQYKEALKHGSSVSYYKNGNKKRQGEYLNHSEKGLFTTWYSNGNLESELDYRVREGYTLLPEYMVLNFYDSLGEQMVNFGEGVYIKYENGLLLDSGRVSNGLKMGEWIGSFKMGKSRYIETYNSGELVKGLSYDSLGKVHHYTQISTMPEYSINGIKGFYQFIMKNLKYPPDARRSGIEGRVYVQFVVDHLGHTTQVRAIKGVFYSLDRSAEEVVEMANHFIPGTIRGQSVKVRMILPIAYRLGRK